MTDKPENPPAFSPDPVKHCKSYRDRGCAHVDGFLCDTRTCTILSTYIAEKDAR